MEGPLVVIYEEDDICIRTSIRTHVALLAILLAWRCLLLAFSFAKSSRCFLQFLYFYNGNTPGVSFSFFSFLNFINKNTRELYISYLLIYKYSIILSTCTRERYRSEVLSSYSIDDMYTVKVRVLRNVNNWNTCVRIITRVY